MDTLNNIFQSFITEYNKIFTIDFIKNPNNKFSLKFSLLVQNLILQAFSNHLNSQNILLAIGSFGRRELSPKSDIEIVFIDISDEQAIIIKDISKEIYNNLGLNIKFFQYQDEDYLNKDFTFFCKLSQARLIYGDINKYNIWYQNINKNITDNLPRIYDKFIAKYNTRIQQYGKFPKTIEPNLKYSAGGLRDLHEAEWIYSILTQKDFVSQNEVMQTNFFLENIVNEKEITIDIAEQINRSYNFILTLRNLLHLIQNKKIDRLEFKDQTIISDLLHDTFGIEDSDIHKQMMNIYFASANTINIFYKNFLKSFKRRISFYIPDELRIILDDDFYQKGGVIYSNKENDFTIAEIIRLFYYRAKNNLFWDDKLKYKVIENVKKYINYDFITPESSAFFREIMELNANVADTLFLMNDIGLLAIIIPEFAEISGYFENTINHKYTFDVHSIYSIKILEELFNTNNKLSLLFYSLKPKERAQIYYALLLHDIAKPIIKAGNEILASEIAYTALSRLGYEDKDILNITKIIKNKRLLDKIAFHENFISSDIINHLVKNINSIPLLTQLYLFTYANLASQSEKIFTPWKKEMLEKLYNLALENLQNSNKIEDEIQPDLLELSEKLKPLIPNISDRDIHTFLFNIRDNRYFSSFNYNEIARQIKFFNENEDQLFAIEIEPNNEYFDIIIIGKYNKYLFPSIAGVLTHFQYDIRESLLVKTKENNLIAKISVNYQKNKKNEININDLKEEFFVELQNVMNGIIDLNYQLFNEQSALKKLEKKIFKKKSFLDIYITENIKYTVIEINAVDKRGFLYKISDAIVNSGLNIYYAKTQTIGHNVECTIFVLTEEGKKVSSINFNLIQNNIIRVYNEL